MSTQKFEIWSEEETGPIYFGECRGNDFADACRNHLQGNRYFNSRDLTHAGSKLHPSKFEAMGTKGELQ